jgi:hypothetical protein
MYSVLNYHNVAKHTEFYLGKLLFNVTSTGNAAWCLKKELYNCIPNVTVWRVLRIFINIK